MTTPPYQPEHAALEADPKRPWKAYASTAVSFIVLFVGFWIADAGAFTAKDAGQALLTALIGSGLTGGVTYGVPNPLRRKVVGP